MKRETSLAVNPAGQRKVAYERKDRGAMAGWRTTTRTLGVLPAISTPTVAEDDEDDDGPMNDEFDLDRADCDCDADGFGR